VIYLIVASFVGWAAFLIQARRKAPPRYQKPAVWIAIAGLVIESGVLLSTIAEQHHWTLHHSVLGVTAFLLPVAGLGCLVIAALKWRRHGRTMTN
jgi:protein-S-isoprenylcysteine O-methyltransferase Ste14